MITLTNKAIDFVKSNEQLCLSRFNNIDEIEMHNQLKVLNAFNKAGLSEQMQEMIRSRAKSAH